MSAPQQLAAARGAFRPPALRRAWPLAVALAVIVALMLGVSCSSHGRPAAVSALLLPDMLVDLPVRPITWFTADPRVEELVIEYEGGSIRTDIYIPGEGAPNAALIFTMGSPPLALDDERLVRLAEDVARAGVVMIVPFSDRLNAELIEGEEIDALIGLFEYAEAQPYIDPDRIGYFGVSVGGSLALVAASDERIADRVDVVAAFGAYYDAYDAFVAIGANEFEYQGAIDAWTPDVHAVEVMALQLIAALQQPNDKRVLCKAFVDRWDRHLCGVAVDDGPPAEDEIAALSNQGTAAYTLITSGDYSVGRALKADLPSSAIARLDAVSPSRVIDGLEAELFIIHDRGDELIPYVESRRLRDAIGDRIDVHYTEVSLFEHVTPRLGRGGDVVVIDSARLYFRLYQLLLVLS